MQQAIKEPDNSGNYHDYVELCKLYDKNENGTMMLAELENFLTNLGKLFDLITAILLFLLLLKAVKLPKLRHKWF